MISTRCCVTMIRLRCPVEDGENAARQKSSAKTDDGKMPQTGRPKKQAAENAAKKKRR